ncbi:hypothetical protein Tco_0473909 [Tanacetum coccineum]
MRRVLGKTLGQREQGPLLELHATLGKMGFGLRFNRLNFTAHILMVGHMECIMNSAQLFWKFELIGVSSVDHERLAPFADLDDFLSGSLELRSGPRIGASQLTVQNTVV